LEKNDE
jgi:hypothetical protein